MNPIEHRYEVKLESCVVTTDITVDPENTHSWVIAVVQPHCGGRVIAELTAKLQINQKIESSPVTLEKVTNIAITGNKPSTGLANKGYGSALLKSALITIEHHFRYQDLSSVKVIGQLSETGDEHPDDDRARRVRFWTKNGFSFDDIDSPTSGIETNLLKCSYDYWGWKINVNPVNNLTVDDRWTEKDA